MAGVHRELRRKGVTLSLLWEEHRADHPRLRLQSLLRADVVGEPTFADAILDRLVHNARRLDLDGPSMRKKTGQEAASEIDAKARG